MATAPCLVVVRVCNFVQMILLVTSGKELLVLVILGSYFLSLKKVMGLGCLHWQSGK